MMDIKKILDEQSNDLIKEDLDVLEMELDTSGEYDRTYIQECKARIKTIREWLSGSKKDEINVGDYLEIENNDMGIVLDFNKILPSGMKDATIMHSLEEMFLNRLDQIRSSRDYKKSFRKMVRDTKIVNEEFMEKYFSTFKPWELEAILSIVEFDEDFLEKYFGAFNHDIMSSYQRFSENFFMKHYSQLNTERVLKNKKNEWREKDKRSKQLDVFLRLKGVKN